MRIVVQVRGTVFVGAAVLLTLALTPGAEASDTFIAPDGNNNTGDGSIAHPYASWKPLCQGNPVLPAGSHIYLRGGTYRNPGFGTGDPNPSSLPDLSCSGVAGGRLDVGPYNGEKVTFEYDGFRGIDVTGAHVDLHDIEVAGVAQSISYADAIADWWTTGSKRFNGDAITISGPDVVIRNNVVRDAPAAGIGGNEGADGAQVLDNVVSNATWWSAKGTSAIKFTQVDDSGLTPTPPKITVRGNVVLRSENRMISRLFSTNVVRMEIDEGNALLLQTDAENGPSGTYSRGYDAFENLLAYNGKGASLRADGIVFTHNTLAGNGTTMDGAGGGLRVTDAPTPGVIATDNVVAAPEGGRAVDVENASIGNLSSCSGNLFRGAFNNAAGCASGTNGNLAVDRPFTNAPDGDFSVAAGYPQFSGAGVPAATLTQLRARAVAAGASLQPTGWCVDKGRLIQDLLDHAPAGSTFDAITKAPDIVVTLPAGNPTGETKVTLKFAIDGPQPERVDLCGLQEDRVYSGTVTGVKITGWDRDANGTGGITRADLLIDGTVVASDTTAPFDAFSIATPAGAGTLDVQARVYDADGNALTSPVTRIGYDNSTPTPTPTPMPTPPPANATPPSSATPTPTPTAAAPTASAGPGASTAVLQPAKLSLARASVLSRSRKLDVVAPITARASGRAAISFRAAGRTTRASFAITGGVIRGRMSITAEQARVGTGILTITYPGDPDTRPASLRSRAANPRSTLTSRRPTTAGGRLRAGGRLTRAARGSVRVTLELQRGRRIVSHSVRGLVRGGAWNVDQALPADVVAAIADRAGTVDATIAYTGQLRPLLRGEQLAYQVLAAP